MSRILPLSAITLNDIDQVGGKAAHLGAMLRAGFPVPPGFVITVDAFVDHFGETTDPLVKPRPPQLKAELMAEVVQGLLDHLGHDTELVVRSSSTEEDGQFASFAGQHSTYYFVNPTRIDQAIVDCWMSLWSASAVAYRRAGWGDIASGEPLRMAVVVQRLVQAVRSGVTFSKHPVEASDDVVIEASWGLGAALVDGRVSPDHIRLDDQGRLQSYTVSDKRFQVLPKQATARLQEVAGSQRHQPVLTEAEAEALANVALQLETLFEGPQDVEWAYDADTLYLLQSRAITSRPEVCDTQRQWVIFKPLLENFTEPLTPLSEDLVAAALPRASATYRGRVYLPIDLVRMLAPFELSDAEAAQLMLLRAQPALRLSPWRALRAGALFALGFLGDGANWLRAARVQRSDLDRYPEVLRRLTRSSRLDLPAFTRRVVWARHSFVPADRQMFALNISSGRYFLYIGLLRALVSRWAPEFPEAQLQALYHGDRRMASLDMLEALGALAALVRRDLQLLASLKDGPDALPTGHPFTVAFEAFLATYGHRGPREMEFAAPRWRERPGDLLSLVLAQAEAPSRERQDAHGPFLAARDQLHQQLRPWQRSVVRRLTAAINRFIELRENTRHYHIMGFDAVRTRILSVEDELLVQGKLKQRGDVFFLRNSELEALQRGWLDPVAAQQTARTRRRQWHRDAAKRPVETINVTQPAAPAADDASVLSGQSACPGAATGIARLLTNPHHSEHLQPGDVLVAPYTDPAWTTLFHRCAAIVVGTGSFLSHAGTIARELQVPCVVDVAGCMERLCDGDEVIVDADAGTVRVVGRS